MLIVCLCIILRCLNISGLTDALSSQKPFLECHLISVSTYTPPHKCTQPPPLQDPDSLLDLLCPNSRSWQGECPPTPQIYFFLRRIGESEGPLVFVGLRTYSQLQKLCRLQKMLWLWGNNRLRSTSNTNHANVLGL